MQNCDEMEKQCFDYETKTCPCVAAAGAELAGAGAPRVVLNGLAPTVAGAPGWRRTDGCFWFTTFRDPTARMVSAMFYCRKQSADPLCGGKSAAWFESATAAQMAKLWGNYGLTNLLLSAPLRPDVRYGNASGTRVGDRAWQRWRGDLRGGDDPSTAAGARNVALVVGALPALYDALVVVERMDASLDVLDCVLPLSGGKTWKALTTTTRASHGSETYAADERRAAAAARRDPDVVRALAGDRRIYDAALARFDEIRLELAPRCPRLASASSPPAAMKATPSAAADLPHTAKRSTDGRGRTAAVVVVGEAFRRHRERPIVEYKDPDAKTGCVDSSEATFNQLVALASVLAKVVGPLARAGYDVAVLAMLYEDCELNHLLKAALERSKVRVSYLSQAHPRYESSNEANKKIIVPSVRAAEAAFDADLFVVVRWDVTWQSDLPLPKATEKRFVKNPWAHETPKSKRGHNRVADAYAEQVFLFDRLAAKDVLEEIESTAGQGLHAFLPNVKNRRGIAASSLWPQFDFKLRGESSQDATFRRDRPYVDCAMGVPEGTTTATAYPACAPAGVDARAATRDVLAALFPPVTAR